MKTILSEKPSVARDLAKVLKADKKGDGFFEGNGYYITWTFGHLVQLSYPETYDPKYKSWTLKDLPILPDTFKRELGKNQGVKEQFNVISSLFNKDDVTEVICATDAGREGELIFRLIYEMAECQKPISRLWISSQTDKAIKDGFASLKPGDDYNPLYDSALSRSEADWLIGMNATRAYTAKCSRGKGVMSVGRVQTPVLNMIVERYFEHTNFKPTDYFEIFADIKHDNGSYQGKWFSGKDDRFFEKGLAESVLEDVKNNPEGKILKVTEKSRKENQPLLYDLTEMQKDANKKFKFSADKTLKVMQALYEQHKVLTYPRTSSRYLSKDIVPQLDGLIQNLKEVGDYSSIAERILQSKLKITKRIVDDAKVTDHHAIIPTDKKANLAALSPDELKIFDLAIKRFLAVFLPECIKDQTEIITTFGSNKFKTIGIVIKEPGWREVYMKDKLDTGEKSKKDQEPEQTLPAVKNDDTVQQKEAVIEAKQTKAPPLYNEASILGAMETAGKSIDDEELREAMKDCGLGTPATRAQILERLISVQYIIRDKNKLIPTDKGCQLIASIQDKELLSSELTGEWEKRLNDMAQGKYNRADYMAQIVEFTKMIVENVVENDITQDQDQIKGIGECPLCGGKVTEMPKSYSCSNWKERDCQFVIWKEIAGKEITSKMAETIMKKGETDLIKGFKSKAGNKFDAKLALKDEKVSFVFDNSFENKAPIGKCPLCKDADVIETPRAFSCSKWKESGCKFAIWKEIAKKTIDEKIAKELIENGKTEKLSGFKSKAGKDFETTLVLKNGRVEFLF